MNLTNKQKEQIRQEYEQWFDSCYGDKTLEERKQLGAFFTPPELTIKMLEQFDTVENKIILDPTCGTGNLLVGCIIAGADPNKVYGVDYDDEFVDLCRKRLSKFNVPSTHIKQGDATKSECLCLDYFDETKKKQIITQVELW